MTLYTLVSYLDTNGTMLLGIYSSPLRAMEGAEINIKAFDKPRVLVWETRSMFREGEKVDGKAWVCSLDGIPAYSIAPRTLDSNYTL